MSGVQSLPSSSPPDRLSRFGVPVCHFARGTTVALLLRLPVPEFFARRVILLSFLVLFLATPLSDVYWDGITFALHIERWLETGRGTAKLFHPNHLLYTPLLATVTMAVRTVVSESGTLAIMQVMSAVVSTASLHRIARLSDRLTGDARAGTWALLLLASTACWWRLAGDASAYPLAVLLLVLAIDAAARPSPRWVLVAGALAGAMLVHQLAALGCLAVLVAGLAARNGRRRFVRSLAALGAAMAFCVTVYAVVAHRYYGARTIVDVVRWAISNTSGTEFRSDAGAGLWLSVRAQVEAIAGLGLESIVDRPVAALVVVASTIAAATALGRAALRARRKCVSAVCECAATDNRDAGRRLMCLVIAWVAPYVVFLSFWEPWFVSYRVFALPALAIGAGAFLAKRSCPAKAWPVSSVVVVSLALLVGNFMVTISPQLSPESNPRVASAIEARRVWTTRTVVIAADLTDVDSTFRLFNPLPTWVLIDRLPEADRAGAVDSAARRYAAAGFDVWLSDGAATLICLEPPPIDGTITALDARVGIQQIRYVRYPSAH